MQKNTKKQSKSNKKKQTVSAMAAARNEGKNERK